MKDASGESEASFHTTYILPIYYLYTSTVAWEAVQFSFLLGF